MHPEFVTSNEPSYHPDPSYPDCLDVMQPPVLPAGTIDPKLVSGNLEYQIPQYDTSQSSFGFPEGDYYQISSPGPSTSASGCVWMGYPGDEATPSPVSPVVDYLGPTHVSFADGCLCGCGQGACIPQREYDRQRTDPLTEDDLQEMILFSVGGKCGYPLTDALKKQYTGLDGRDNKVFIGFKSSISIRVEWPPYDKWTRQIRTLNWRKQTDNITLAKAATEVAKRMQIFFKEMEGKPADPSYYQYRVQSGVIDMDHLELVALKRVAKASYTPHFRLITPSKPQ